MSDDTTKELPQDPAKVNVNDPEELSYWCRKFGCIPSNLFAAVYFAGDSPEAVEKYIKEKSIYSP